MHKNLTTLITTYLMQNCKLYKFKQNTCTSYNFLDPLQPHYYTLQQGPHYTEKKPYYRR